MASYLLHTLNNCFDEIFLNENKILIFPHWKNISSNQLLYLEISLVHTLVSRNFCQNIMMRVIFRYFHNVHCVSRTFLTKISWKQCNGFTIKKLQKELISRNFLGVIVNFAFLHNVEQKVFIVSTEKIQIYSWLYKKVHRFHGIFAIGIKIITTKLNLLQS